MKRDAKWWISRCVVPALLVTALLGALALGPGGAQIAVAAAPAKQAVAATSPQARAAQEAFWSALHGDRYEALPEVTESLLQAYLAEPRDPNLPLLIGHAHLWKVAERGRLPAVAASITDEFILAAHYFGEAKRLRGGDERVSGWLGGVTLALGTIHKDEKVLRAGYFELQEAKRRYPEFNDFSASYAMSTLPPTDPRFPEVLADMWDNYDRCAGPGAAATHDDPRYDRFLPLETRSGPKRVCWSSSIAPHNFEGFFLHFGDVLTKSGDAARARVMYGNARLSRTYGAWRYRDVLEKRIQDAEERARRFRSADAASWPEVMVGSTFACAACHAD